MTERYPRRAILKHLQGMEREDVVRFCKFEMEQRALELLETGWRHRGVPMPAEAEVRMRELTRQYKRYARVMREHSA